MKARGLYDAAVEGLEIAVNSGNWYYKKVLANAREGLRRAQQGRGSDD